MFVMWDQNLFNSFLKNQSISGKQISMEVFHQNHFISFILVMKSRILRKGNWITIIRVLKNQSISGKQISMEVFHQNHFISFILVMKSRILRKGNWITIIRVPWRDVKAGSFGFRCRRKTLENYSRENPHSQVGTENPIHYSATLVFSFIQLCVLCILKAPLSYMCDPFYVLKKHQNHSCTHHKIHVISRGHYHLKNTIDFWIPRQKQISKIQFV